jgi:hypothetical protein
VAAGYTSFFPTAAEQNLAGFVAGPDYDWQQNVHTAKVVLPELRPENLAHTGQERQTRRAATDTVHAMSMGDLSNSMRTDLYNRVRSALLLGQHGQDAVQRALQDAADEVTAELRNETATLLEPKTLRAGSRETVTLSALTWKAYLGAPTDVGLGTIALVLRSGERPQIWQRIDLGECLLVGGLSSMLTLPPDTAALDPDQDETRQCMYLHAAAAVIQATL